MGVPQQHHRKIFNAGGGGPAVGVHTSAAVAASASASVTTAGITTQASGSSFWICTENDQGVTFSTPTDNKSNTYSQIGTTLSVNTTDFKRWDSINGTGGSGHTVTYATAGTSFASVWFVEIKNSTGGVDQQNRQATSSSPFDSPSVTTGTANEVLLGCAVDNSTTTGDNFTANLSFTLLDQITNGATFGTGASAGMAVSATGTYKSEFTSVQGTTMGVSIDTFK